jgi:5'-methylthioadenosine phosphorylase
MSQTSPRPTADVGVIGGSGLYAFLEPVAEVYPQTPWGPPSDPIVIAEVHGRRVAFVPRHGRDHRLPPHRIPYRANVWALASLGVQQIVAPCAVGALRTELAAGALVVPDQLIDRTSGRPQTFYDEGGAVHVAFADPYCPTGRRVTLAEATGAGWPVTDGGTLVVIEGPRFSTRAESRWFAGNGWSLVGMTGHPEAVLARELARCYTAVCLVTDLDAGAQPGEGVNQQEVFDLFGSLIPPLRELLVAIIGGLPERRECPCVRALDGITVPVGPP